MSGSKRKAIYRKKHSKIRVIRHGCLNKSKVKLHSPSKLYQRRKNFKQFIKENFADDPFLSRGNWPKIKTHIPAYQYFKQFSETNLGSAFIDLVLKDNKIRLKNKKPLFIVKYEKDLTGQQALGWGNSIRLGGKFPKPGRFPGGERKNPITIIAHEFGHTRFFYLKRGGKGLLDCPCSEKGKDVKIEDERDIVLYIENPFLIKRGHEPRYTYRLKNTTINIITGKKHPIGTHTILKNDPAVPAVVGKKGSRI